MADTRDVQSWWAEHPMTYGDVHGESRWDGEDAQPGTVAFYDRVDREFLGWNRPLHGRRPFDRIFPYDEYAGRPVLEVGCGLGTMAMCWAQAGADVTAVDLNAVAVERTRERLALRGLTGAVQQADARALPFEDASFDYVWSWGVLHHSAELDRSLGELMRVLRPGGGFGVMVYHRRSLLHWYMTEYVEGFLHYERRFLDPVALASRYGDAAREEGNPHTWPVTRHELAGMLRPDSDDATIRVLGTDLDSVLQWLVPGVGARLPRWVKKPWARRFGWSLWAHGRRNQATSR
jgi:ubiquinone/menaquinone biosynthesis C-methylase UbiE